MKNPPRRAYRMDARARAAEKTGDAILEATAALWIEGSLSDVTLAAVAERAGVSVRTVIRRHGSREGLLRAMLDADPLGIRASREVKESAGVDGALDALLGHYEEHGDAVLLVLAAEAGMAEAALLAEHGRRVHRAWCARVFAQALPPPRRRDHVECLDALVAATDLYAWKLLRRDLGRSPAEARRVMGRVVHALVGQMEESR